MAGGLIPFSEDVGSASSPWTVTDGLKIVVVDDPPGSGKEWLKIFVDPLDGAGENNWARLIVTVMYDGYMESDPILRVFAGVTLDTTEIKVTFQVDLARMNRMISGLRVYGANRWQADFASSAQWLD